MKVTILSLGIGFLVEIAAFVCWLNEVPFVEAFHWPSVTAVRAILGPPTGDSLPVAHIGLTFTFQWVFTAIIIYALVRLVRYACHKNA